MHCLFARLHRPPQRATLVARLPPLPDRVGLGRVLDLDDLGAEVSEHAPCERPGEERAQLDHAHAGERPDAPGLVDSRLQRHRQLGHAVASF